MNAGKLTIDADANSQIFNPAVNPTTISIKGGDFVVNGGKSLLRPGAGNVTLAVDAAAKLKINTNLGIGRVVDTTVVTGIELAADKAAAITQGTATAITEKAPAAPEAPKIDVPVTSDASVAAIAAVALISVAAAVVVLRKRVNG
jgi:nucleoid-associated protein YgaU